MNMEPFDDAGPGAGSRERLDRLRARGMRPAARPERSVLPWLISAVLLAFALGLIANPWFEHSVRSQLPGIVGAPDTIAPATTGMSAASSAASSAAITTLQARLTALETHPAADVAGKLGDSNSTAASEVATADRLARIESRLDAAEHGSPPVTARLDQLTAAIATLSGRLDVAAQAQQAVVVSGTAAADNAKALLAVLATHHAIEGGTRLGALEAPLRQQLMATYPAAVEAVAALGRDPVTLAGLREGFDRLRGQLTGEPPPSGDWRSSLDAALATIVRVHPAPKTDSVTASVAAAAVALRAGDVAAARDRLAALPTVPRARAAAWLMAADRYVAGMRGLAALDAAMLAPAR
jgi:hypothetical protein